MANLAKLTDRQSLAYILRSAMTYGRQPAWDCPCCGARDFERVSRKALVTVLVRCRSCKLLYRCPRDPEGSEEDFYQDAYKSGGLTTEMPDAGTVARLKANRFRGSGKDFSQKIAVLEALGVPKGARVLDFGASWGYATWQMRQAGYDASGYEISTPRARFGEERLDVDIATTEESLRGPFDALFSSHVIEHFPNPREALAMGRRLLRKGGVFIAFTPNGSLRRIAGGQAAYDHSWGRLHPVYLDEVFYRHSLPELPTFFTSRGYNAWSDLSDIAGWDRRSNGEGDLTNPELLFVFVNS